MDKEKVFAMPFGKIYAALVAKAERKGRTRAEAEEIMCWFTGYTPEQLAEFAGSELGYGDFFRNAPALNPDRVKVTGSICGVKIEQIEDPLMQDIRRLDKQIDELAKGRPMDKILRREPEKSLEKLLKTTTEKTADQVDWTKAWSKRYPVLASYQQEVDIPRYAAGLREMLEQLKAEHGYGEVDAVLVLKDILAHEMKRGAK